MYLYIDSPILKTLGALQYHRPVLSHEEVDKSHPTIEMTFILIIVDCKKTFYQFTAEEIQN